MLASTVQFSSYGRKPPSTSAPTPTATSEDGSTATKTRNHQPPDRRPAARRTSAPRRPFPQDPTACPDPRPARRTRSTRLNAGVLTPTATRGGQLVDVPPNEATTPEHSPGQWPLDSTGERQSQDAP